MAPHSLSPGSASRWSVSAFRLPSRLLRPLSARAAQGAVPDAQGAEIGCGQAVPRLKCDRRHIGSPRALETYRSGWARCFQAPAAATADDGDDQRGLSSAGAEPHAGHCRSLGHISVSALKPGVLYLMGRPRDIWLAGPPEQRWDPTQLMHREWVPLLGKAPAQAWAREGSVPGTRVQRECKLEQHRV